jgi:hypothetical protein
MASFQRITNRNPTAKAVSPRSPPTHRTNPRVQLRCSATDGGGMRARRLPPAPAAIRHPSPSPMHPSQYSPFFGFSISAAGGGGASGLRGSTTGASGVAATVLFASVAKYTAPARRAAASPRRT